MNDAERVAAIESRLSVVESACNDYHSQLILLVNALKGAYLFANDYYT
jgi:hypothetical protein